MHCSPPPLLPPAVQGREADGYGRMNEALEGTMAPGDEAGPGVMSPGRRRWGFSGCDGSTLKNTSASFPPACALVSPSFRPTIFHFLCFTSCWKSAIILYPSVTFSSTLTFRKEKGSLQASSALLSIVLTLECLGHDWLLWVSLQPLLRSCLLWLGIHL